MGEAELRYDVFYYVRSEGISDRIVPADEIEPGPTHACFQTEMAGRILDWSQSAGWFGRTAQEQPWQVFSTMDDGITALGVSGLIRQGATVTPPEAFVSVGDGVLDEPAQAPAEPDAETA